MAAAPEVLEPGELATRLGAWRGEGLALYEALATAFERAIREGTVAPGVRLPAERSLCRQLHVSRGTVVAAYDQLRSRGLVETRRGSGTVVLATASPVSGPREAHLTSALTSDSIFRGAVSLDEETIDLRGAYWFGSDALSAEVLERAASRVLGMDHSHGYHVLGLPSLRAAIAGRFDQLGLPTRPEQVLVTSGAQQAIALVVQLHVGPGDEAVVDDPTYPGAVDAVLAQQATVRPVPVQATGTDLQALRDVLERRAPRLVYLVLSVHNPTGVVMPRLARQRLAELLADHDTVVVDDTTLIETQRAGSIPAPLAAFADAETQRRILTVGSVSKPLWGGLRIGWVRASEATISRLARLKTIADLGTPVTSQVVADELLQDAERRFAARRQGLQQRHDVLAGRLAEDLPDWTWSTPAGGLCLWVELGGHDAAEFAHVAASHGVSVIPAGMSSASLRFPSHLRLPFGQPPAVLGEAVDRLAAAWQDYLGRLERSDGTNLSVLV